MAALSLEHTLTVDAALTAADVGNGAGPACDRFHLHVQHRPLELTLLARPPHDRWKHPRLDLARYRTALVQDRTRVANRLHKALEDAGVKLATVASDILGGFGPRHAAGALSSDVDHGRNRSVQLRGRADRGLAFARSRLPQR